MRTARILLVEDDPGHQYLLGSALHRGDASLDLVPVGSHEDFLEAIAGPPFDCVITDFYLSNAWEADELIGELRRVQPDCPVIVVSGSDDQEVVIKSMRSGGVDFIHKDDAVMEDRLWERVEIVLDRKRREDKERRVVERRLLHLKEMAEKDPLTGLFNRRMMSDLLKRDGRKSFDRRGEVSVVMADIDHFKKINDTHGHLCGDRVLREVAQAIRGMGGYDTAVRWGGEEFLILALGASHAKAMRWAERLRRRVEALSIDNHGESVPVTVSIGMSTIRSPDFDQGAIDRADQALYQAKAMGRNRVCTWRMVDFDRALADFSPCTKVKDLLTAIGRGDLHLGPTQHEHLTGHSVQVSRMARRIGKRMGMSAEELEQLAWAGLFHDVGKAYVPEEILAKPSALSADERFLIDRHAAEGAELVGRHGGNERITSSIRHHHHPYRDGVGTREVEVPLGARILNLADAFSTMITDRPYRRARRATSALRELRKERGFQFDPRVVDAAAACLGSDGDSLRPEAREPIPV